MKKLKIYFKIRVRFYNNIIFLHVILLFQFKVIMSNIFDLLKYLNFLSMCASVTLSQV